jgi:hypothetical protein
LNPVFIASPSKQRQLRQPFWQALSNYDMRMSTLLRHEFVLVSWQPQTGDHH